MTRWVRACAVDDVDLEDVVPFDDNGVDYAIFRSPEGEFFATAGHCTHERTLLCEGLVMGNLIECPRHNGRFEYATGVAKGAPVITDLESYPTKIDDGHVYLELP